MQQRKGKKKDIQESLVEDVVKKTSNEPVPRSYEKFITRSIIGAFMIGAFAIILSSDHLIITLFVVILQILVFKELLAVRYNAAKEANIGWFRLLNWYLLAVSMFTLYGKIILVRLPFKVALFARITKYHMWVSFVLYVIAFVTFILYLRKPYYKYQITQITWTLMTLMFVVFQANFIIQNIFDGIVWFLLPCAIIICNDIFAYFSGFFFGKKFINRPFLTVSPNKTWEGFIGATFWTLLLGVILSEFVSQSQWLTCPRTENHRMFEPLHCAPQPVFLPHAYPVPDSVTSFLDKQFHWHLETITVRPLILHSLVLSLFGSLIAPFGGFFASAIKRAFNIKDFDNIFPGHGGFTDRTDCQYIMGFFTWVYFHTFIKVAALDYQTIAESVLALSLVERQALLTRLQESIQSTLNNETSIF